MARITVEDCLKKVPNHFELAVLATKRAHQLIKGARPLSISLRAKTMSRLSASTVTRGAHKLARACYYIMQDEVPFDVAKAFAG